MRHRMMSGAMPTVRSSFTECCTRLGLELARGGDVGHEREVDVAGVVAADVAAHLADRLEERQRLDVADRAADLDDQHVDALGRGLDRGLDLVGDVRDHLHRAAEVVAAALLREHRVVDAARGDVVALAHARVAEALVVAEVEIGLGAVVGDVHLAVLERVHRARVDVQVRVELEEGDAQAARLEQRAERRRREALAERREHAARHEDELGRPPGHRAPLPLIAPRAVALPLRASLDADRVDRHERLRQRVAARRSRSSSVSSGVRELALRARDSPRNTG